MQSIRDAFGSALATAIVDGSFGLLTLILMYSYSPALTAVTLVFVAGYLVARMMITTRQRYNKEHLIVCKARELSVMLETIRGMVTLRMFSKESDRLSVLQNRLVDTAKSHYTVDKLDAAVANIKLLATGIENILCIALAVSMVIDRKISIGMLLAFLAYKQQFIERTVTFVDQIARLRLLELDVERLSDIALEVDDESCKEVTSPIHNLNGSIRVSDVVFRYGSLEAPVLNGVDLEVAAGEHIAITGASGGGKSTLLKVMLGLIQPEAGAIYVDGLPLSRYGYKPYRQQVAAVLQEDFLFTGSIADNIALFETDYSMEDVETAARMAAVHDDIMRMPMRYNTAISDLASTLSGGQRQRILLARAIFRKPRILFLDEATSHLDPQTESNVSECVADLGITRIVVAHRVETVMKADRVFSLTGGHLLEVQHPRELIRKSI